MKVRAARGVPAAISLLALLGRAPVREQSRLQLFVSVTR